LLRENGRIADTSRVVASREEGWARFVTCDRPDERVGCSLVGGKPVTVVTVRLRTPDTATVIVADHFVMTRSCPMGPPFERPVLGATSNQVFRMVYADGAWRNMRATLTEQC
jgi:hypothetical protein